MARTELLVDGSKWQASNQAYPPVRAWDLSKVKAKGARGVYLKATDGLGVDPEFERNYANALMLQFEVIACYHFFRDWYSGEAQAAHFLKIVKPVVAGRKTSYGLDQEVRTSAKKLWYFADGIYQDTGQYPDFYGSPNSWNNYTSDSYWPPSKYKPKFVVCDLWQSQVPLPEYDDGVRVVSLTPLEPWASAGKEAMLHQYSFKNGLGPAYGSQEGADIDLNLVDPVWIEKHRIVYDVFDPPPPVSTGLRMQVLVPTLNVRSGPGTNFAIVGSLNESDIITVKNVAGSSAWVEFDGGFAAVEYGATRYMEPVS